MASYHIPERLGATCQHKPEWREWLGKLPSVLLELEQRWEIVLGVPFDGPNVSCSWVAPARRKDGTSVIFKMGLPAMESRDELAGLRFWRGDPTVFLYESDEAHNAFLLEHCEPGTLLKTLPEPKQDDVLAAMLKRLWRKPSEPHVFRHLSEMLAFWGQETRTDEALWPDPGLVREGLRLFEELSRPDAKSDVLLATDLHASNILAAQREPWLVIDPKPFVGDAAYDVTQHLLHNCTERLRSDPLGTMRHFADLLGRDDARVQLWMFARAAADPRDNWDDFSLARLLAP
jgi:streptomycin 6-kinase